MRVNGELMDLDQVFETEMTVGRAVSCGRGLSQHEIPEPEEIPYPDGEGWQLVSVLAVSFNEPFLQYFWQRQLESDEQDAFADDQQPNVNVSLTG